MNKKIGKGLFILLLALILIAPGEIKHIHDDKCGYDPDTETGCIYEYDVMPLDNKDPGK